MSSDGYIPFHRPSVGQEELREIAAVLDSGWLTSGPRTQQFEKEFKTYVGATHALATNSCTASLHLALAALNIGPRDEVITTPLTFCSTVATILHVGAVPVLADIGPDGNIDPCAVEARVTERTRAIVPVHLAGLPCEMESIWNTARRFGLSVVEDAAHAVGSWLGGSPIGRGDPTKGHSSDAVAFSFYATKNLTTGEGGMVTTHRADLEARMRRLCLHGIDKDAWNRYSEKGNWFYQVQEPGFKYNLSDLQSALGLAQLRKQEEFIKIRTRYARAYSQAFADLDEVETPPDPPHVRHCWHLYILRLNLSRLRIDRGEFISALREAGIGASVHFIPIPLHPFFESFATRPENACPKAMELYPRTVSLPLYPAMTELEVERVAQAVRTIVKASRKRSYAGASTAA